MHIVSSALRMDASTVTREVSQNNVNIGISTRFYQRPDFQLKLPESGGEGFRSRVHGVEQSRLISSTQVEGDGHGDEHVFAVSRGRDGGLIAQPGSEWVSGQISSDTDQGSLQRLSGSSGFAVSSTFERVVYRNEQLDMEAAGQIVTSDGRTMDVHLAAKLERNEVRIDQGTASIISGNFIDPLVLSFDDGMSVLSDSDFCFDLDCDGELERIAALRKGSGYLVNDLNGDGQVNNGTELFGPKTGEGFEELRGYDTDGNDWIDAADPIFSELKLWMGAGGSEARLISLSEAGVGALSLNAAGTEFSLKDSGGRVLGQLSNAGLFLMENGEARPLVEVDLSDLDEENSAPGSGEVRLVLERLQQVIRERRRRMEQQAVQRVLRWQQDVNDKRYGELLSRLLELGSDVEKTAG